MTISATVFKFKHTTIHCCLDGSIVKSLLRRIHQNKKITKINIYMKINLDFLAYSLLLIWASYCNNIFCLTWMENSIYSKHNHFYLSCSNVNPARGRLGVRIPVATDRRRKTCSDRSTAKRSAIGVSVTGSGDDH